MDKYTCIYIFICLYFYLFHIFSNINAKSPIPRAPQLCKNSEPSFLDTNFLLLLCSLQIFAHQSQLRTTFHISYVMPHDFCFIVEICKATSFLQFTSLGPDCAYFMLPNKRLQVTDSLSEICIAPHYFFPVRIGRIYFSSQPLCTSFHVLNAGVLMGQLRERRNLKLFPNIPILAS